MSGAGAVYLAAAEAAIEAGPGRAARVELGAEVLRAVAVRRPALAAALGRDPGIGPVRPCEPFSAFGTWQYRPEAVSRAVVAPCARYGAIRFHERIRIDR